ncbi:hypothetical protein ACP70R_019677 [Stipagrostis hirtigluma subsp. patula]
MGTMTLPPGFRFHPTDDELVGYYLKRKVDNLKIELEVIPVIDLYKSEPWELPEKSFLPKRDLEWFFFCPRDRKYPNGSRTNRATTTGYWKATGKDRRIACDGGVYGLRKTLVFYRGRAPGGERTDWVMHEYRLCQDLAHGACNFIGAYALCRVIKRHEAGLLQGEPTARAKGAAAAGGSGAAGARSGQMSKVPSNSSIVSSEQLSAFTPTNSSPPHLDIGGGMCTMAESRITFQSPLGYGGDACDMTATATMSSSSLPPPPPLFTPTQMCAPQQDMFFLGGDDFTAAEPRFFGGDMGSVSEHELKWDDHTGAVNAFTAGTELWNTSPSPMLCRQASDGIDDLAAWFSFPSEDSRVVY